MAKIALFVLLVIVLIVVAGLFGGDYSSLMIGSILAACIGIISGYIES